MGITNIKQIADAVEGSDSIELSNDKTSLRIKNLGELPEFKPKKKVKTDEKPKESVNPYENLEVYSAIYPELSSLFPSIRSRPSPLDISRRAS